ncbi:hypothetical protein GCM10009850_044440 [Nonomuraea monospora]|uniref:Uncharacterized protein n=1 Tax=Nonomuraea monospora TaxID=568818 RepID=A0ABN3CJA5_9ACTN
MSTVSSLAFTDGSIWFPAAPGTQPVDGGSTLDGTGVAATADQNHIGGVARAQEARAARGRQTAHPPFNWEQSLSSSQEAAVVILDNLMMVPPRPTHDAGSVAIDGLNVTFTTALVSRGRGAQGGRGR